MTSGHMGEAARRFFPTNQQEREEKNNMREVMVSMMVIHDGTICGPNGARYMLPMMSNSIRMRWNGRNRR